MLSFCDILMMVESLTWLNLILMWLYIIHHVLMIIYTLCLHDVTSLILGFNGVINSIGSSSSEILIIIDSGKTCFANHWKMRVFIMPTLSSLVAPQVVIMTSCDATNDENWESSWCQLNHHDVCIMMTLSFQWSVSNHNLNHCRLIISLLNVGTMYFNTLRLRRNGRHFTDDIFKCISLNENIWIPIKISLKFVPKSLINNISA